MTANSTDQTYLQFEGGPVGVHVRPENVDVLQLSTLPRPTQGRSHRNYTPI